MKIVVVIPSRYRSTRFEGKALAKIAGKPMVQHVYERASQAAQVTDVVVATDDRRIVDVVEGFDGKAIMTSETNRSGTDRVAEAAAAMGLAQKDILVNVQGDQPLLHPANLDLVVAPILNEPDTEFSTLAFPIVDKREIDDPKDIKVVFDQQGFALYYSRSTIPFCRDPGIDFDTYKHLGIYAYTRRFLEIYRTLPVGKLEEIEKLEQLRAIEYGHPSRVVVTPHDSPEVDLPIDIERIEEKMDTQVSYP